MRIRDVSSRVGFWRRSDAMLVKEFIQLRRDRVTFANDRDHPGDAARCCSATPSTPRRAICRPRCCCRRTAISARSVLEALENTSYFTRHPRGRTSEAEFDDLLQSGKVLFGVEIPRGFERAVRRGDRPALLVAADATDPVAAGSALGALGRRRADRAGARPRLPGDPAALPFEIRTHAATTRPADRQPQHRAGPGRHHPDHDHADLHRAVGDARDRARHHGEPAVDADQAARDHARQDRALRAVGFIQAALIVGIGVAAVRRADRRQRAAAGAADARCSSPPICRSATPSRPSCRTSCRRCRCR